MNPVVGQLGPVLWRVGDIVAGVLFGKGPWLALPTGAERRRGDSSLSAANAVVAPFRSGPMASNAAYLSDGKAGTVENIWLDEFHGLRISIIGHEGK
jgi:hypothetical protein